MKKALILSALAMFFSAAPGAGRLAAQESEEAKGAEATQWLDTVVVSATRTDETLRNLPISPVVISQEDIQRRPNADLSDLLEDAGIMIERQYILGGQVVLRGLSGNISGTDVQSDVLMLKDGHRIGTGSMLRFPSKNIGRIEILRGPAALQYGSAAMGGVVNVITKEGQGEFSAFGEGGLGSWGRYDYGLGFSGEKNDFDYSFAYSRLKQTKDYETGDGQKYLGTTIGDKYETSLNLGYTFNEKHRLGIIHSYIDLQDYGFTGSIHDMTKADAMTNVLNHLSRTSGRGYMTDFDYAGASENDRFSWQAKYFIGQDTQEGQTVNITYHNDIQGAQGRITGNFDEINSSLTLGFDWTEYDFETASANLHQYKYTDLGGYLMAQTRFLEDRLVFSGGARLNHISNETREHGGHQFSENKLTPAFGVSYLANDWLKLRGNYARGYRAPSPNEMFGEGPTMIGRNSVTINSPMMGGNVTTSNVWLVPNTDLKPQSSDSLEAGFDVEYSGFTGSLTGFYSRFQDKIERVDTKWEKAFDINDLEAFGMPHFPPPGMQMADWMTKYGMFYAFRGEYVFFNGLRMPPYVATAQYVNFGNADMAGLEWALKWDLGETYAWNFALAPYSRGTWLPLAKYKGGPEDGLNMRKVPKWYTSYGLEFQTPDNDLWLDLNFLSRDRQRTAVMTSDPNISDTQPGWTIANLRLLKTLYDASAYGKISLQGEVANIFDKYYEVNPTYPLPGRSFYAGLRFDFN